jgi:hypothetical protein
LCRWRASGARGRPPRSSTGAAVSRGEALAEVEPTRIEPVTSCLQIGRRLWWVLTIGRQWPHLHGNGQRRRSLVRLFSVGTWSLLGPHHCFRSPLNRSREAPNSRSLSKGPTPANAVRAPALSPTRERPGGQPPLSLEHCVLLSSCFIFNEVVGALLFCHTRGNIAGPRMSAAGRRSLTTDSAGRQPAMSQSVEWQSHGRFGGDALKYRVRGADEPSGSSAYSS